MAILIPINKYVQNYGYTCTLHFQCHVADLFGMAVTIAPGQTCLAGWAILLREL